MSGSQAYLYRMPSGVPGEVTRGWGNSIIEAQIVTPTTFNSGASSPTAYGVPMNVDNTAGNIGNMRTVAVGDTAIYGVLVRPYPTGASQDPLGTSTPPANGPCDILKSGYMTVLLSLGSIACVKGGQVYVWVAATSGSHVQGGFEAASSGSTISYTGAYFMGPADASNNVEIAVSP